MTLETLGCRETFIFSHRWMPLYLNLRAPSADGQCALQNPFILFKITYLCNILETTREKKCSFLNLLSQMPVTPHAQGHASD